MPSEHSTYTELRAVRAALERTVFRDKFVRIFTDNTVLVARLMSWYSPVPVARAELLALLTLCLSWGLQLRPYYVPARLNSVADYLSRVPLPV